MKRFISCIVACIFFTFPLFSENEEVEMPIEEKPFVVVICSYNNIKFYEKNLTSVFAQKYSNYRVIYTDDCSSDGMSEAVDSFVNFHNMREKVTVIHNARRQGAMENFFRAIHTCRNDEIVVMLDGDDWFPNRKVLSFLNKVYQDPDIWLTWGSYVYYPSGIIGECSKPVPKDIVEANKFRQFVQPVWKFSHLKSFYAALFKHINIEDFVWKGQFFESTSDQAIMLPLMELAGEHSFFIDRVLYINNRDNPLNDDKVAQEKQSACMHYIWSLPPYKPLKYLEK